MNLSAELQREIYIQINIDAKTSSHRIDILLHEAVTTEMLKIQRENQIRQNIDIEHKKTTN
jgi:hypothetical protein